EKNLFLFLKSFSALCLFHCRYLCHALEGHVPSRPKVHICMINGKKTRSRTIVYKTLHFLAHHGDVLKLLVNAIKNVKPIYEVKKMGIACKKRDDLHKLTQTNHIFLHYKWL
ncbi:hypothetical protein CY35_04G121900, partial [Sphagnum magellanicum]